MPNANGIESGDEANGVNAAALAAKPKVGEASASSQSSSSLESPGSRRGSSHWYTGVQGGASAGVVNSELDYRSDVCALFQRLGLVFA